MMKTFSSKNGLPLKITTEWTSDEYWQRKHKDTDDLYSMRVDGWLVRINGVKFPRPQLSNDVDGEFMDYSFRYTPEEGQTPKGKKIAIKRALMEYEQN